MKLGNRRITKAIGGSIGKLSAKATYYIKQRYDRLSEERRQACRELIGETGFTAGIRWITG